MKKLGLGLGISFLLGALAGLLIGLASTGVEGWKLFALAGGSGVVVALARTLPRGY